MLSHSAVSDSLRPHGLQPTRCLCPWGFSRQEYWSGLPCPPPGDLPDPEIEPNSPALQVNSLPSEPPGKPKNPGVVEWVAYSFSFSDPGIEPRSSTLQTDSLPAELPGKPILTYDILHLFKCTIVFFPNVYTCKTKIIKLSVILKCFLLCFGDPILSDPPFLCQGKISLLSDLQINLHFLYFHICGIT